jgi:O-antigen ligase
MSMMVLTLLFLMEKEKSVKIIFTGFNILGISLATIGIIGWILSICGIHNEATQIYLDYPYFGDAHRLKAFTTTPSMYISIITLCIVLSLCNYLFYEKTKLHLFASVFFTITALLTLTKSFLYIVAAWIVLILFKYYKNEVAIIFTFLGFLILQVVLTHFLIIPNEKSNSEKFQSSPYTSNEIIYRGQDFSIIGSGYYTFKKTAWKLFNEFSLSGVGPGNYNRQVARLKAEGFYPANLANYDPHSAYLGALAETGIAGFIAMMLLGLFITGLFVKMEVKSDPFSFSLFLLFLIMIAEGVSMDTMNFRHYWVIIALILFQYLNINSNK